MYCALLLCVVKCCGLLPGTRTHCTGEPGEACQCASPLKTKLIANLSQIHIAKFFYMLLRVSMCFQAHGHAVRKEPGAAHQHAPAAGYCDPKHKMCC